MLVKEAMDGLEPLGPSTSAGTVIIKSKSHICMAPVLEVLISNQKQHKKNEICFLIMSASWHGHCYMDRILILISDTMESAESG